MIYNLDNENLSISINNIGGELYSIKGKKEKIEFLWNGNKDFWKFRSPILFPIVGKVNDGKYFVEGQPFELPQHGLARIKEFKMIEKTINSITFELMYNEDTLKVYPYKFSLKIKYFIFNDSLNIKYTVENLDNKTINFSIGGHPAFMCPILPEEKFEDYYLEFEKNENANIMQINEFGYFTEQDIPYLKNEKFINFSPKGFTPDTLVFKNLKSSIINLKSKNHSKYIEFNFSNFPYLGIWTKSTGAPFVCIEPWFGHADFVNFKGEFKDKAGILTLPKNQIFSCDYTITIHQ
ncbi:aldose 1-epimerase family protein [Clostridium tarantellae]|uniref:Aldose 1-epimerase family protein n=1 Tax=Clostridium tarantellae TaxID=39493 RepID=A0A6I1MPW7_9CLOT|nr:aldose 1-epimerase family protein [Clostridium tarantellae]MPQ45104.1 aldose 1-epimerase family protein [Clostridium tarantellae]